MVYYRKYRPQTISELDLSSVREKLTAILSSKNLPHALLFTGSKGLGKTSAARILAKAINCEKPNGFEPCNKCGNCVSITNGSNIDVLEIDAASNGGVEEIRELRERVKFASSTLKYKVYIIDEVHMLSTGAFNALLKTLEEPPSHVIFVLATTELWKLPATIVSRTFQIKFEKPTKEEFINSLDRIVKGEKLKIGDGVLEKVYTLAEGSFRDGAKLLEELVLNSNNKIITVDLFDTTFKTKGISDEVYELLKAYEARDAKMGLLTISKLFESGADFKIVIERLVDHLRGLLMMRNDIKSEEKDVAGLTVSDIKNLLGLANEAYGELKVSVIPQLPLELMTVKFCIIDGGKSLVDSQTEVKSENIAAGSKVTEQTREISAQKKPVASNKSKIPNDKNLLPLLIQKLNEINKPGAALLRSCTDAVIDGSEMVITTPFPIHAERLKSDKVFPDLEKSAENLLSKIVEVRIKILPN